MGKKTQKNKLKQRTQKKENHHHQHSNHPFSLKK